MTTALVLLRNLLAQVVVELELRVEPSPLAPTVPEVMAAMSLSTTKMAQLPPAEILHLHISFKASEVVVDRLVLEIVKQVGKLFLVVVAMEHLGMVANSSW